MADKKYIKVLLIIFTLVLIWSAIKPHDYFTWFLETVPAYAALVILFLTYKKFPLTKFLYTWILLHAIVLMVGGHYTYAEVPLFNWIKDVFGLGRNHYDRVGHVMQGLVPALVARELLIRKSIVTNRKWLYFIVLSICVSISVYYEFFEWWTSIATGEAADSFLGTQGDVWDTQWDMFLAFIGANIALLFFSKMHDKYIEAVS